ncbi:MAG: VWA domain-containing protein [Candidatus Riflebacteria bacterium]|nr:VWA domain-containing protein [Candidatus Riflebacteria bacterium]
MIRIHRFLQMAGCCSILYALFLNLPAISGKTDDWCFNGGQIAPSTQFLLLGIALILLPPLCRWLWGFISVSLVQVLVVCGIIAVLAAISVPNFRKAREQAGGYSVGGAKDINTFRFNLLRGYLPDSTAITHEGLFYDYYFDIPDESIVSSEVASTPSLNTASQTGQFRPTCSWAVLPDPISGKTETFLAVGLRSTLDTSKIERKKLNIVVVLDISGSMGAGFSSYYYDHSNEIDIEKAEGDEDFRLSKIRVATKAIATMLDHLRPEDSFGMVVFDSYAQITKPLRKIEKTDMDAIRSHMQLQPRGSTNMEAGYRLGLSLFDSWEGVNPLEVENRIVFLTDAMPNTGQIDRNGLFGIARAAADARIYTTFIGMGVDFQTELVDHITKTRGANYLAVHSSYEFKQRLAKEFDYLVTPLLFGLRVNLRSDDFGIEAVYGSPEANQATNELMYVNTLFPAPLEKDAVKGGVILLKLGSKGAGNMVHLTAEYEDRAGKKFSTEVDAAAPRNVTAFCLATDTRKAVLLAREVNLMKEWIRDVRGPEDEAPENKPGSNGRTYWEHESMSLSVSPAMAAKIKVFKSHMEEESRIIADRSLTREIDMLDKILKTADDGKNKSAPGK